MSSCQPGDRIRLSEMGYELDYRVILVDSFGIHIHLINDPYRHFLLIANPNSISNREYILYQKLNPVGICMSKVVPSYNPEIVGLHPEQDCPV